MPLKSDLRSGIGDVSGQASRELLLRMFNAAIAAAQPSLCIPRHLPAPPAGRMIVIGAGKASAAMAKAVEDNWKGDLTGLVVTRYGYAVPCSRIEIIEAAHPVPDAASVDAARRILDTVGNLREDDVVLCLISGGGSSLLVAPLEGLTLEDKQSINQSLLRSGATISEMNCVRRHLSAIKGGRLAAACHPAKVVTLLISDVPGDRPTDIASGPTVPDPTTCADALAIIKRYGVELPPTATDILESGRGESVKPGDSRLARSETRFIATPQMALEAAASAVRDAGIRVHILGDSIEGEARDVGKVIAGIAVHASAGTPCRCAPGMASRSSHRASCSRAARRPLPFAAADGAGAMSSSCCRWPSRSTDIPAFMQWRAIRMASMVWRRSPARTSRPTRSNAPGRWASSRKSASRTTMATVCLVRWGIR